uniref:Immunoglobulin V-set domain-containing protein n=1 Tax=Oryzias latipes TaxID=8090 RepID=A0A3P9M795_ORYLA
MRLRFFVHTICLLTGCLVNSLALPSPVYPVTVVSTVGSEVVLPCCWKSQLDEAANSIHHIQWVMPPYTVFEQRGEEKWQALEFGGRLQILEERLGSGDCSLVIKDVQIRDTGKYESFMVVEAVRSKRTRVFLQSVKLSVTDNKSWQSHRPGEDFVIDLRTPYSMTVVFLGKNSSEWSLLWTKEDEQTSERLEKSPRGDKLTMKNLQFSDEGIYKVLDEQGVSVSTIQLSVEDIEHDKLRMSQTSQTGGTAQSSSSRVFASAVLFFTVQILHLV